MMPAISSQEDKKNAIDVPRQVKFNRAPIAAHGGAKDSWSYAMRSTNQTMRGIGASKFDNVYSSSPTTWDYVLKSDGMRYMSHREKFNALDKNGDGFIDARELRDVLGASKHDIDSLISQADKAGNGKIDYAEFSSLLRRSLSPAVTPDITPTSSPLSRSPNTFAGFMSGGLPRKTEKGNNKVQPTMISTYSTVTEPRWTEPGGFIDFN